MRAFLTLNHIPYEWLDRDREPERVRLLGPANDTAAFAVVDNAVWVREPLTARKMAEALGISTKPKDPSYDVVIVGGGPAAV